MIGHPARLRSPLVKRRAYVLLNRAVNAVVRRLNLKRFRGAPVLYLTTTGRKSGQRRTVPLLYVRDGDSWVVAASNGGADWTPAWWLNLQASPDDAVVEVDGRTVAVDGAEVGEDERSVWWDRLNETLPVFDGYQAKVRRQIAIVRLTPRRS